MGCNNLWLNIKQYNSMKQYSTMYNVENLGQTPLMQNACYTSEIQYFLIHILYYTRALLFISENDN